MTTTEPTRKQRCPLCAGKRSGPWDDICEEHKATPGVVKYPPDCVGFAADVGDRARLPGQYGPLSQVDGVIVSVDDGFATVDLGKWGQVGCLVELLRPAPPEAS